MTFEITSEFRRTHYLIDRMDETPAVNELWCHCGARIMPDCDISSASIAEEYERHLIVDGGTTKEAIDEWFAAHV